MFGRGCEGLVAPKRVLCTSVLPGYNRNWMWKADRRLWAILSWRVAWVCGVVRTGWALEFSWPSNWAVGQCDRVHLGVVCGGGCGLLALSRGSGTGDYLPLCLEAGGNGEPGQSDGPAHPPTSEPTHTEARHAPKPAPGTPGPPGAPHHTAQDPKASTPGLCLVAG